jgi:hypothetical protein
VPSRAYKPRAPTLYPDTSTICDALLAATGSAGADPAYAPLFPWFERVAKNANLCLGLTHIGELAQWSKTAEAGAAAAWLDSMNVVWVLGVEATEHAEIEHWVQVAIGRTTPPKFVPFAPSLGSALAQINPSASAALLGNPSVPQLLALARHVEWSRYTQGGFQVAKMIRDDRAEMAAEGGTRDELARRVAQKRDDYLRGMAREAHARLRGKPGYSTRLPVAEIEDRFVKLYHSDANALPGLRVAWAYDAAFIQAVERRTEGSIKDRDQLPGSFGDRSHAFVGGGYCNVFTCDRPTALAVGRARQSLGLPPPFACGGYPGGAGQFVADLTSTIV